MWISHIAVQLLSHAWLSGTSRTVACQASFFTISGVCLNSYPLSQWFLYIHISPPSWIFLSSHHTTPLGHHSATGWTPCLQQPPTSFLYYKWQCIYCNATLPIHLTLSFSIFELKWVLCERCPSEVSSTPLILSSQSLLHCTSCFEHLYDYPSVRQ